ncbi:hypothetical protein LX16_3626 [Stackebrandtia albiflava]|uniref:Uncharacterized protein n=1 Tax=Stackebrandtia albiflava TaxID=406432 RepID=A0A562V4P3_9ACTN|nr:hypothetical protein [Stackebrandtia albiflava]TWJ12859.1 hypothetical protein LX16_3626 [Stackebrandtia albiflava]
MKQELASYGPYRVGDLIDISMEPVDVEVLSGTERFLTVRWPW